MDRRDNEKICLSCSINNNEPEDSVSANCRRQPARNGQCCWLSNHNGMTVVVAFLCDGYYGNCRDNNFDNYGFADLYLPPRQYGGYYLLSLTFFLTVSRSVSAFHRHPSIHQLIHKIMAGALLSGGIIIIHKLIFNKSPKLSKHYRCCC